MIDITLEQLAAIVAADHAADPLVGSSVAASDADGFDFLVLARALKSSGFNASDDDVEALREALRSALGREAARYLDGSIDP